MDFFSQAGEKSILMLVFSHPLAGLGHGRIFISRPPRNHPFVIGVHAPAGLTLATLNPGGAGHELGRIHFSRPAE